MSIYRGAGGSGDAVNDASSEATLVQTLVTSATTQAANAATSATAAQAASTQAVISQGLAADSATAAATSETNAETAETNAETAQAAAEAAQVAAETAQTAAELAETNAETAETNAETAQAAAEAAQAAAETAQTAAELAETNASDSATAAATSATNAAASYDEFDDRYLGSKSSNPTVDNDGNALITGALYFNTTVPEIRVWTGSVWNPISAGGTVVSSFNTRNGDVTLTSSDVTTALTYTPLAPAAIGTTVQAYDADLTTLGAGGSGARSFLGLAIGTDVQAYDAQLADIAGLTPTDNSFIVGNGTNFVAEDASTARTSLGLGTAATTASTDYATAAQGTKADSALQPATIGVSVQAYDVDTAKYDAATANFTGTLQNGGSNVVVDSDIGSTVQAYDADTTKNDVANTFSTNQIISVTDNSNAALRITQLGTGNALLVEDSTNPDSTPFVIDSLGNVIKGNNTAVLYASGVSPQIQLNIAGAGTMGISRFSANTSHNAFVFLKSRGATIEDYTTVASGDNLGSVNFYGTDGTAGILAAQILSAVDGTPGTNDMPGRLVFFTTADGASSSTERMRIDSAGNVGIGRDSSTYRLEVSQPRTAGSITRLARFGAQDTTNPTLGTGVEIFLTAQNSTERGCAIRSFNEVTTNDYSLSFLVNASAAAPIERLIIHGNTGVIELLNNSGFQIARTAVTSPAATDGNVFSGTYTPTQVSTNTNVDSVTFSVGQYMRVGNVVTVSGLIQINATLTATQTVVKFSLPIASAFTNSFQLGGTGSSSASGSYGTVNASFIADTTNDCVEMRLTPTSIVTEDYRFHFTYRIV
jgi:hypothetical protein